MSKMIDQYRCTRCGDCVTVCPNEGIRDVNGEFRVNEELCTRCYGFATDPRCETVCPADALADAAPVREADLAFRATFLRPERFPRD